MDRDVLENKLVICSAKNRTSNKDKKEMITKIPRSFPEHNITMFSPVAEDLNSIVPLALPNFGAGEELGSESKIWLNLSRIT